jgi:hypothetical protein
MADAITTVPKPGPRKRGSWLRIILGVLVVLVVLLVTVYFVVTSSAFLQKQILPRVSRAINARVTVSSADIHPFSEIILHDLKIQATNQAPVLVAHEARVRYSLLDILGGNIHVDEIALVSPTIQEVENPDGTSNLDPLLKSQEKSAGKKASQPGKASKPMKVDIRKVTISNASVLRIQNHQAGTRDLVQLTNVSVTLTGVKNGEPGKVEFAAIFRDENNPPAPAMYGLLEAKMDGSFHFALTPDLKPASILGDAHLEISQAGGSFSDFAKLDGMLHCDYSLQDIKAIDLNFEKDSVPLGELRVSGPFDAQKSEGRLNVELLSVDRQVLNLFGAKSGLDFGSTTITFTNQVELSKGGAAISAAGRLSASKFQLSRTNQATPPIDLHADYNVSLDKTEKSAQLRALNLAGTENGRPLLRAELTSPMTLAWGGQTNAVGDSSFNFAVTKLNLAEWKTFAGNLASGGTLDLTLKLLSQQGGRRLTFDATNEIQNLTADMGGKQFSDTTVSLRTHGEAADFNAFNLGSFNLTVAKSNHAAVTISGSGTYDLTNAAADLQIMMRATIGPLLQLAGETNVVANSGVAQLKAHVTQKNQTQTVAGDLTLTNFTGKIARNEFTNFGAAMTLDVSKTPEQIEIRKVAGGLSQGKNKGGNFELSGTYSLTNKPSQFAVTLSGFNEHGLRPFLEPLLADRKLVSVAVAGSASVQRSPNGDSAVKADLQVTNLVVNDPAQQIPATPLEARVQLDAGLAKQIADVRQLEITLTPTERAKNQFQLKGRVDASRTNAIQGSLTLAADSLDVTRYYDLFSSTNKSGAKASGASKPAGGGTPAAPTAAAGATNQLPFRNFTVDANVGAFYLREIAATNFHATVKLDGSQVVLRPFELTLNGSPMHVTADVDLSVPGYKYALTFNATNVPFTPLWNTFKPEEKGEMGGTLSALVDIKGVGTTGESLQKTLTGQFDIGTTNLNLSVDKIHSRMLRMLVVFVAKLPEIANNPLGAISSLAGGALNGGLSGGLSGDVAQSPIDVITARGNAGNGRVVLQQAVVRSSVFEGTVTNGTVTLAQVLTNSAIDIPVGISLNKSIAQRVPTLVPENTPTNVNYVKLPDFFTETGTVGDPKPKINTVALGKGVVQKFIPGLGGGTNGSSGNLLQGLGGLLQNRSNTNQPATNQSSPVDNLLNHFLGK